MPPNKPGIELPKPDVGRESAEPLGEVTVYEAPEGGPRVEVIVGEETVWLTQAQMADLFGRDQSVIARHIRHVYQESELPEEGSMQNLHRTSEEGGRPAVVYNLDVVISVGYRVKSQQGTQFRIWATNTLKDHLIQGYTLNEKRLIGRGVELEQAVSLMTATLQHQRLLTDQGEAVLGVVQRYTRSWRILREYDGDGLSPAPERTSIPTASLDIDTARDTIRALRDDIVARGENPGLFGQEHDDTLASILLNIEQTWEDQPLYPTLESRAAHLLYFVIKDHPLSDGNKRAGSLLFLDYLRRNSALMGSNGQPRFSDTALVALALLVAESEASHKELVIRLILNLLAEDRP
ncbi:MAG: RhuM family protein [Candidatus Dormiibacterota bacterium]